MVLKVSAFLKSSLGAIIWAIEKGLGERVGGAKGLADVRWLNANTNMAKQNPLKKKDFIFLERAMITLSLLRTSVDFLQNFESKETNVRSAPCTVKQQGGGTSMNPQPEIRCMTSHVASRTNDDFKYLIGSD